LTVFGIPFSVIFRCHLFQQHPTPMKPQTLIVVLLQCSAAFAGNIAAHLPESNYSVPAAGKTVERPAALQIVEWYGFLPDGIHHPGGYGFRQIAEHQGSPAGMKEFSWCTIDPLSLPDDTIRARQGSTPIANDVRFESGMFSNVSYNRYLGTRLMLGYEFLRCINLVAHISALDTWSRQPGSIKYGFGLGAAVPLRQSNWSPFMEAGTGMYGRLFATSSYSYVSAGTRFYLDRRWFVNSSLTYGESSRHISGGFFSPRISEKASHIDLTIGIGITSL